MKTFSTVARSMFAGAILGAGAIEGIHAQSKSPAYVIGQIEVTNQKEYKMEYAPLVLKALSAADPGFKVLARGGRTVSIDGEPPASRVVLYAFTDMDHAVAAYNSPGYKAARNVGKKHANKFRFLQLRGSNKRAPLRSAAKLLPRDTPRRSAANIAELPGLLRA